MRHRKQYDRRFKAQVAIEAIKSQKSVAQIARDYGVNPSQVSQWKKQALEEIPGFFERGRSKASEGSEQHVAELYRQIDQLKVEIDWLREKTEQLR